MTKSKELKRYDKNILPCYKNEKRAITNKTDKNWKRPGTKYYFGYKDFTHNFRAQGVKMTHKVLREKSNCVVLLVK